MAVALTCHHTSAMGLPADTSTIPESAENSTAPNGNTETEPLYLAKLQAKSLDESLGAKEQTDAMRRYFSQYQQWKTLQVRLATAIANVGASEFYKSMCEALCDHECCGCTGSVGKIEEVVCLCLGNLQENAPVYQLALLILLLDKLGLDHDKCSIFDPCHSSQEVDVLRHLGFTVLQKNTQAKIHVDRMTLFYMPHGDHFLTDNLIAANPDTLQLVAILGNNLAWVCTEEATDTDCAADFVMLETSRAPAVQKVLSLVKETHLEDTWSGKVRLQLAHLPPRVSESFGTLDVICDVLDCTLSTFRATSMECRGKSNERAFLGSAL